MIAIKTICTAVDFAGYIVGANLGRVRITTARTNKTLPLHLPVLDFDRLSPLGVPETQSAFHPREQRNAFRRRDARQQRKIGVALGIVDHLRGRFARLKPGAHFLQSRSKRFNLLFAAPLYDVL